ncbi:DUF4817 domain-containing protein [Trichonephila clavipes]|uniref:DUF4817 domain-containing protein n=1 Tax=Trichonephila clavipes TaxID=2585209 RepID=A0A8X6WJK0_TRICX|nr:DUF4817 domain-containing protein [Trichonephila clavipes]
MARRHFLKLIQVVFIASRWSHPCLAACGERTLAACIRFRFTGQSHDVIAWHTIGYLSRSVLVCTDSTFNSARYYSGVLRLEALPFIRVQRNLTFLQDNTRSHVVGTVRNFLDAENDRLLPWLAHSPDPSSIENVCDEAHFLLNGYVNKQNCHIWSEANPQVYVETPLHPEKLTVWCTLWAGGIIGPYFFKNDEGHNVTVNGDRYRAMIINFFIPELNNHDVQELWFQQDGATCHTARAPIDLLKDTFDDRLISRFGPVNWPPRSCDLTPLDYFLWGYVKSLVYADKPQTLDHLEDNIRRVIADIRPQMLEKVIESWKSRLDYIRASRGSPMPEIIFKM